MRKIFLLSLLLLAACGGAPKLGSTGSVVQVVDQKELPPPDQTDLMQSSRPYHIGPFDKLSIEVFSLPELSRQDVQIDASGRLSYPLVGVVEASGKTPGELESLLEEKLRGRWIRDPQVSVNLRETLSQVVTIDGQVRSPGLYPVIGRMTLMRAVATAKGLDEFARQEDVVVFRTVGGQKMAALYNLKAIRRGNYLDPEIYANDVVVVGDSQSRRMFKDLLTVFSTLAYPIIAIIQN